MRKIASPSKLLIAAMVLGLGLFAMLNIQTIKLGLAVSSSETRPALLHDAKWQDPASAVQFNRRFAPGTSERALIAWLQSNRFAIDQPHRRAGRRIEGLPCNEMIEVTWTAGSNDALTGTSAIVREAGCL